jgi:hypothetical protein
LELEDCPRARWAQSAAHFADVSAGEEHRATMVFVRRHSGPVERIGKAQSN